MGPNLPRAGPGLSVLVLPVWAWGVEKNSNLRFSSGTNNAVVVWIIEENFKSVKEWSTSLPYLGVFTSVILSRPRHFMARIKNTLREGLEGLLATSEVFVNFTLAHLLESLTLTNIFHFCIPQDVLSPERPTDSNAAPGYSWKFWSVRGSIGSAVDFL